MARVKVRTYLSPTLVLLAFGWGAGRSRDDFDGPARDGELPSNTSPIQKFMWWDARIDDQDRGRRFTYTVTPVVGDPASPRLLSGSATTVSADLPLAGQDGVGSYFNRAVVSSQAFSRTFGTGDLPPQRLREALAWLANGMQGVVPGFVVVDAETTHPVIYTRSANMSNNAVHRNDENLLEITGSPRLAAIYFAEFLRLYEHDRARRHIDRPGRRRPNLALTKDASWARNAFRPGTSQFLSRVRLAAIPG